MSADIFSQDAFRAAIEINAALWLIVFCALVKAVGFLA